MTLTTGIDTIILFATAATLLLVAVYVWLHTRGKPVRWTFFIFVSGIATWIIGFALLTTYGTFFADKVVHYGGLVLLTGLILFAHTFPDETRRKIPWLLLTPLLLIAVYVIPSNLLVADIIHHPDGRIEPVIGDLLGWYGLIYLIYVVWAFTLFTRAYRNTTSRGRIQLIYLLSGIAFLVLSLLVADVFLPAMFGIYEFNLFGPLASIPFVGLTAYAIVRHQLMDIRIIIKRGFVYSVLLACVVTFYIGILQAFRYAFGIQGELPTLLSAIITTILGIFTAPHIERVFRKITDRIFFKDVYDYADALHTLSGVLHANIAFSDLVHESERALEQILRPSFVRVAFGRARMRSGKHKSEITIPITLEGEEMGTIHLGQKRSGDSYTPQDIRLLETFAYQAATALSRAQLYADAQDQAAILERKVEERTRELSLARTREEHMLNDISHNLQTPLTILQTRLDALKPLLTANREVQALEQSLTRLSSFIYDLLSLARIDNEDARHGNMLNISELVQELSEEIRVIAEARGIIMHSSIAPDVFVHGDARRLREACMNIASNALKYLPDTGLREVSVVLAASPDTVTVTIKDTGIGISKEDLPHIFDRFYRGKDIPNETRGTGLGLAITKRIIEQHGGTIDAVSSVDVGTTVRITLPL